MLSFFFAHSESLCLLRARTVDSKCCIPTNTRRISQPQTSPHPWISLWMINVRICPQTSVALKLMLCKLAYLTKLLVVSLHNPRSLNLVNLGILDHVNCGHYHVKMTICTFFFPFHSFVLIPMLLYPDLKIHWFPLTVSKTVCNFRGIMLK